MQDVGPRQADRPQGAARLPRQGVVAGLQRSGIGVARSTATAVTLFCGEPSISRSE